MVGCDDAGVTYQALVFIIALLIARTRVRDCISVPARTAVPVNALYMRT